MQEVLNNLKNKYKIEANDTIIVGCSGGPDSMCLLYNLILLRKKTPISLVCAHVNHNVRKVSNKEKIFVEDWCKKNNVVFESMVIENYGDDNFHNEARNIRYNFFESLIKKYNSKFLMTAHHGDDLIETIMMRLTRGSTVKGYGGFSEIVEKGNYKIIRPLIYVTKEEILEFNKKEKIPYVIDKSNFKTKYTRNRYRKTLLPFLKKEESQVHKKFLKFSKILEEYNDYIDSQTTKFFQTVYENNTLDLDKYFTLESLFQERIIYSILEKIYQDDLMLVNDRHVTLIQKLILSKKSNGYIYLPNNVKVIKAYNKLQIVIEINDISNYEIELIDFATLPNGKNLELVSEWDTNGNDVCRLSSNEITLPLYVRTRKHGDKMTVKGMIGHKKIKDIMIDSKIPLNQRELWPIVVDSKDNIVWLPGLKKSKFNKQKNDKCDIIIRYY